MVLGPRGETTFCVKVVRATGPSFGLLLAVLGLLWAPFFGSLVPPRPVSSTQVSHFNFSKIPLQLFKNPLSSRSPFKKGFFAFVDLIGAAEGSSKPLGNGCKRRGFGVQGGTIKGGGKQQLST